MNDDFSPPPIARQHCRHYSYETGLEGGPRCAVDVDLSAPGACLACMPDPKRDCALREDWTAEDRATWESYATASRLRMIAAMAALPSVGPFEMKSVECPNCGGRLENSRTRNRAYVACSTPHCVRFEAALHRDGKPWPPRDDV